MQLMSVEGLTRENVASHLQKYRLQLRRSCSAKVSFTSVYSPHLSSMRWRVKPGSGRHDG